MIEVIKLYRSPGGTFVCFFDLRWSNLTAWIRAWTVWTAWIRASSVQSAYMRSARDGKMLCSAVDAIHSFMRTVQSNALLRHAQHVDREMLRFLLLLVRPRSRSAEF